jgi:hypothetical protein
MQTKIAVRKLDHAATVSKNDIASLLAPAVGFKSRSVTSDEVFDKFDANSCLDTSLHDINLFRKKLPFLNLAFAGTRSFWTMLKPYLEEAEENGFAADQLLVVDSLLAGPSAVFLAAIGDGDYVFPRARNVLHVSHANGQKLSAVQLIGALDQCLTDPGDCLA